MENNDSVPRGIVCTPAQYERSLIDSSIHCLTRSETIGLTVAAHPAILSLFAVLYFFTIFLRNVAWRIRHISRKELHVFDGPMDLLLFSLFSADLLQDIGHLMDIKWIHDGKVEAGGFCSAQGILQQLGETGVAMTTLMIAMYTFVGGWLGKDIKLMPIWFTRGLLTGIWLFIAFTTMLGNVINRGNGKHFHSPTPYWCWISSDYLQWRLWGQYIWMWITLGVSFFIYAPLYLQSRGNLIFDKHTWWKFSLQRAELSADPELKVIRRRSLVMLSYPVVYCISILPFTIVRWIGFIRERGHSVSHTPLIVTFTVATIFSITGACNVVLLFFTRPDFGKARCITSGRPSSLRDSEEHPLHNLEENEQGPLLRGMA